MTSAYYGRNAAPWGDHLWFQFGEGFWRLDGDGNLDPIGYERLNGLDAELRSPAVAFAGHGTWFGYAATAGGHLMKFGEWVAPGSGDVDQFADVWNGSIAEWAGKTPVCAAVESVAEGVPYLRVGFSDGSIESTRLPQHSPDPADDEDCEFVTGGTGEESYVEWPDHHALAQADVKRWRGFSATGPVLDADNYVTVQYRTDPGDAWTELGTPLTTSGQRVNLPSGVASYELMVRELLHGTRTSTPEVESVVLHEQVRPELLLEYQATAIAGNNVARRDGSVDRRTAAQVRTALQATAGPGPTTVELPTGESTEMDFVDYGEALRNENARWGLEWDIPVTMVKFRGNTVYGTWDRAAVYDWDEAASYDWDQAPTL